MSWNWKEKEVDIEGEHSIIRARVIGCTCSGCRFSVPMPKELAAKVNDPDKLLCTKLDMVVGIWQNPCDDFQ